MVDDNGFNDLINMGLAGHGILVIWYWHQCGTKADSQVVGIHHVLITVLRKTGQTDTVGNTVAVTVEQVELCWYLLIQECKQVSHDNDHRPLKRHDYLLKLVSSLCTRVKL